MHDPLMLNFNTDTHTETAGVNTERLSRWHELITLDVGVKYPLAATALQDEWGLPFEPPPPPSVGSRGCTPDKLQKEYARELIKAYGQLDMMYGYLLTKFTQSTFTALKLNVDFRGEKLHLPKGENIHLLLKSVHDTFYESGNKSAEEASLEALCTLVNSRQKAGEEPDAFRKALLVRERRCFESSGVEIPDAMMAIIFFKGLGDQFDPHRGQMRNHASLSETGKLPKTMDAMLAQLLRLDGAMTSGGASAMSAFGMGFQEQQRPGAAKERHTREQKDDFNIKRLKKTIEEQQAKIKIYEAETKALKEMETKGGSARDRGYVSGDKSRGTDRDAGKDRDTKKRDDREAEKRHGGDGKVVRFKDGKSADNKKGGKKPPSGTYGINQGAFAGAADFGSDDSEDLDRGRESDDS